MAQRVITQLISDLSGTEIAEGSGETVEFSYRGTSYTIDLTGKEAVEFDHAITNYLENATKVGARRKAVSRASEYKAKEVRAWAKANGLVVPDRGRIPGEIIERYLAAS